MRFDIFRPTRYLPAVLGFRDFERLREVRMRQSTSFQPASALAASRATSTALALAGALAVSAVLALASCSQDPGDYDYHGGTQDLPAIDVSGGDGNIAPSDQAAPGDAEGSDTPAPGDAEGSDAPAPSDVEGSDLPAPSEAEGSDTPAPSDAEGSDSSDPPLECGDTLFTYQAAPGVSEVFVSGSFNNWAKDAASADAMSDPDGDNLWSVVIHLSPGIYPYKFVVDGDWIMDPANPNQADDGYGGFNSVITVEECPVPGSLALKSHETDPAGKSFSAVFGFEGEAPSNVEVSVDWKPAPGAAKISGNEVTVEVTGLSAGIHDVRVTSGGKTLLLKVYIGVSTDWRDALLYFAITDRFSNGDKGNDAPVQGCELANNYQGGDFAGLTQKINEGYFDALAVSAIWMSWPVDNPSGFEQGGRPQQHYCGMDPKTAPMVTTTFAGYHGYWPSDLYKVEEHFGTMKALQDLVVAAHSHGIRVLLDFTANHVYETSPFFQEHANDNYFHFPAEICQDVGWDNKPISCWFTSHLPDLNYSNPAVVEDVLDYAMYWATQSGCDGFRLDAVKHIEFEFITALRKRAHEVMELTGIDFYIVGETFTGDAGLIKSFVGGDKIHGQFDFPANMQVLKGFASQEIGLGDMDAEVRKAKAVYGPDALMSNFIGNHDISRFLSVASGDIKCGIWDVVSDIAQGWLFPPGQPASDVGYKKLQLAFTYIMTIPGIPLIYYGDEFGMPGAGDPDNRRMMRFGNDLNGNEKGALAYLKKLGTTRAAHPALSKGEWTAPLWTEPDFLAYGRVFGSDRAVILINRSDAPKAGELDVTATALPPGAELTDALSGTTAKIGQGNKLPFNVPGKSAMIFVGK